MDRKWNTYIPTTNERISIRPNMALALTPGIQISEIQDDYKNFTYACLHHDVKRKRIPVDKSSCTIL